MYNYNKLKGKIVEMYSSRRAFSQALGISEWTLSFKLRGKYDFTQSEILRSCKLLGIPMKEVSAYFLTRMFRNQHKKTKQ